MLFFVGLFPTKNGIAQPKFIQNMGQFHPNSIYQLNHGAGKFYFEKNKVKYQLFEKNKLDELQENTNLHTMKTTFLEMTPQNGKVMFRHSKK